MRCIRPVLGGAAVSLAACVGATAVAGGPTLVQTSWTIVSASGVTTLSAHGSVGDGGARRTYDADVRVRWRQVGSSASGGRTVSFSFGSLPRYTPGALDTGQRSTIAGVVATASGAASVADASGSKSCTLRGSVPTGFFVDSAARELFLSVGRTTTGRLVAIVDGQSANAVASDPSCGVGLPYPDTVREKVRPLPLSVVSKRTRGTLVTLNLRRVEPLVEQGVTLGTLVETATIKLRLESAL